MAKRPARPKPKLGTPTAAKKPGTVKPKPLRKRAGEPLRKPLNLALQGGGAHGAFTWGVLDALLADGRIVLDGISGTSAGAMNAVVLADGYARGGPDEARAHLERFWRGVADDGAAFSSLGDWIDRTFAFWRPPGFNPFGTFEQLSMLFSPYRMNPLNINPLRAQLKRLVDFDRVKACREIQLFIAATNVQTGKIKVFTGDEITPEAVIASTTLPYFFQAAEIDGEYYWDGGYTGNPPLWPFYTFTGSEDILLVQINPVRRDQLPRTSQEIMERVSEVTFNSSLLKELRAIDFVNRLMDEGRLDPEKYRVNRMHRIDATHALANHSASSKLNTGWDFFQGLKAAGEHAARVWLAEHFNDLGVRSTLDLRAEFE